MSTTSDLNRLEIDESSKEESENESGSGSKEKSDDDNYIPYDTPNKPGKITQKKENNFIRELGLSKDRPEFLVSWLKHNASLSRINRLENEIFELLKFLVLKNVCQSAIKSDRSFEMYRGHRQKQRQQRDRRCLKTRFFSIRESQNLMKI